MCHFLQMSRPSKRGGLKGSLRFSNYTDLVNLNVFLLWLLIPQTVLALRGSNGVAKGALKPVPRP